MKTLVIPYEPKLKDGQAQDKINTYKFTQSNIGPDVDIYCCHNKEILKFELTVREPITEVKNFHPNFAIK